MPLTLRKQTELEIEVEEHGTFRAVGLPLDAVTTADLLGIITSLEEAATVEDLRRVTDLCSTKTERKHKRNQRQTNESTSLDSAKYVFHVESMWNHLKVHSARGGCVFTP